MAVEHEASLNNVTVAFSFNVKPIVGVKFVVLGEVDWMLKLVKLGATLSYVIDHGVDAILPLFAKSVAALAATLADTADPVAVIARV